MKLFEKKDNIQIEEDDLQDAKLSSIDFSDKTTKKRAFLNVLGARLAMKMLFSQKIEANNLYSLYTIHNVVEEIDIADIYFNGIKIDVRLVFNREEIFIPKSHFELGLLPDLYFVFELYEDFSGVEFLGFFEPKTLNIQNANKNFYFYEYDRLLDPKTVKNFLNDFIVEDKLNISKNNLKNPEELFMSLVDKEISQKNKLDLFKCLANDISLREKMVEFENFEILSKVAAKNDDLTKDGVLDIVGAQQLFEDEVTSLAEDKAEIIEEVLTDLLEVYDTSADIESGGIEFLEEESNEIPSYVQVDDELSENDNSSDDNLIDLDSFVEDLENTEESKNNNLGALSAGILIGGAVGGGIAATAAAGAELENDLAKLGLNAVSAGINIGTEAISSGINLANSAAEKSKNIVETEIEKKDDLLDELGEDLILDDEIQADNYLNLNEDNKNESEEMYENLEEKLPELEFKNTFEEKIVLPEVKLEDVSKGESIILSKDETQLEALTDLEKYNDIESESIENDSFDDVSEFNDFNNEEDYLEDNSAIEEKFFGNVENQEQEIEKIEEDFDINSDEVLDESHSDVLHDNTILTDETDNLPQTSKTEEDVDNEKNNEINASVTDNEGIYNEQDDFLAQIDDFLNDVEFSGEKLELLEEAFTLDDLKDIPSTSSATQEEGNPIDTTSKDLEQNSETLPDKTPSLGKKEQINLLFQSEKINNLLNTNIDGKKIVESLVKDKKKMIIAASLASVVLASIVIGTSLHNNNNISAPQNGTNAPLSAQDQNMTNLLKGDSANSDLMNQQSQDQNADPLAQSQQASQANPQAGANRDMGKAVSDAFLSEPVNATISKVAWEVPEDLAYNDGFRKYLQIAGNNLKLNLQNNLLLATELAYSNKVVVDLTIGGDGSLQSSNIITSSGSKQIDSLVLQSVKETLMYLKMPSSELRGGSVNATLIINF